MPYAGIHGADVPAEATLLYKIPAGAYVSDVDLESPAMLAGIQTGDVITYFNGYSIGSFVQYASALNKTQNGQEVELRLMRPYQDEYKEMTFFITIGELK
jgi:S1-C subfamily serine protease